MEPPADRRWRSMNVNLHFLNSHRGKRPSGRRLERTRARREMSPDKRERGRRETKTRVLNRQSAATFFPSVLIVGRFSPRTAGASCCFCFSVSRPEPTGIYWMLKIKSIVFVFIISSVFLFSIFIILLCNDIYICTTAKLFLNMFPPWSCCTPLCCGCGNFQCGLNSGIGNENPIT